MSRVVRKESSNIESRIESKTYQNSEFHKPRQIPIFQAIVESRARRALQGSIDC